MLKIFHFRYHKAKTKFLCNPEKGILELEQKLPFSWHAFNETPKYEVNIAYLCNSVETYLGKISLM